MCEHHNTTGNERGLNIEKRMVKEVKERKRDQKTREHETRKKSWIVNEDQKNSLQAKCTNQRC